MSLGTDFPLYTNALREIENDLLRKQGQQLADQAIELHKEISRMLNDLKKPTIYSQLCRDMHFSPKNTAPL